MFSSVLGAKRACSGVHVASRVFLSLLEFLMVFSGFLESDQCQDTRVFSSVLSFVVAFSSCLEFGRVLSGFLLFSCVFSRLLKFSRVFSAPREREAPPALVELERKY